MIYLFLANGFEEMETIIPIDIIRRAKIGLITVGIGSKIIVGAHNLVVTADIEDKEVVLGKPDMIILPGGDVGANNLAESSLVKSAISYCNAEHRYIAAICAAPAIIGKMGLLRGKEATCYPGYESQLIGAKLSHKSVCVDDNIITSKGPGTAIEFALKLVELITNSATSINIKEDILAD